MKFFVFGWTFRLMDLMIVWKWDFLNSRVEKKFVVNLTVFGIYECKSTNGCFGEG